MDVNLIRENLKKIYNCIFITLIDYSEQYFVKGLEKIEDGIAYRYFKILNDNNLEEVKDEHILAYFREMYEINDENNY